MKQKPYILVDNAELLPRPVWEILSSYDETRGLHIILNTENVDTLLERMSEIDQIRVMSPNQSFLKKFQVQKFIGPDQSAL